MRNLIILFLSLTVALSAGAAASEKVSLEKLKSYSAADMKADKDAKAKKKKGPFKIDDMFKTLDETVISITKKELKSSPELIRELSRVALLTFQNDPSLYAAELLLPLYKQDPKGFENALSSFSKEDRESLIEALKDKNYEATHGNG